MNDQPQLDLEAARAALASLDDSAAAQAADDLRTMAFHISDRIHYTESRLSTVAGLGGGLIAFGTAILSLISVFGHDAPSWFALAVLLFSVSSIFTGLAVWFVYSRQTNFPYAFKGVAGPRLWFYRDAIPTVDTFDIPILSYLKPDGKKAKDAATHIRGEYVTNWSAFSLRATSTLSDPREYALENLRQVYLLHFNEFYKNKFLSHLRKVIGSLIRWLLTPQLTLIIVLAAKELLLA